VSDLLKLRASDAEDLAILAACLQDAILPIQDMLYEPDARRFVAVANRFRWEGPEPDAEAFERIHAGLVVEQVDAVKLRNIDRADRSLMLNLLTIDLVTGEGGSSLRLLCAGERDIRIDVSGIEVQLEDFGDPWPTTRRPRHALGGPQ
jgi:hypothetical protein